MNKIRCNFRKFSAILALSVAAIVFLPEVAFAKGDVVGYASGDCGDVTIEQLNRFTHVMAVDLYMDANCKKIMYGAKKNFENVCKYQIVFVSLQRNILSKSDRS